MLEYASIEVGTGEPLGCALCAPEGATAYFTLADLDARIRAVSEGWSVGPGPNVVLAGPEPFAHPELPALVAACVEAGVERIGLETDAAALSAAANAHGVLRAGVRHLRVRLLDADPERGDRLGGRSGRTRDALAGVQAYLAAAEEAGLSVMVTGIVPVCRHNLETLPVSVVVAATHGFSALRLVATDDMPDGIEAMIAAACDTGMVNRLWVEADPALPLPHTHRLHTVPEAVRSV